MKFKKLGYKNYRVVYGTDTTGMALTTMGRFAHAHFNTELGLLGKNGGAYALPLLSARHDRQQNFANLRAELLKLDAFTSDQVQTLMLPRLGCGAGGYTDAEVLGVIQDLMADDRLSNVALPGIWGKTQVVWVSAEIDLLDPAQFKQLLALQPEMLIFVDDGRFDKDSLALLMPQLPNVLVHRVKLGKAFIEADNYMFAAWHAKVALVAEHELGRSNAERSAMVTTAFKANVPVTVVIQG